VRRRLGWRQGRQHVASTPRPSPLCV
jgi:hypothetical protein